MRATLGTTYRTLHNQLQQMNVRLDKLRTTAATGKRINKPSDDPTALRPTLHARSEITASNRFIRTIDTAQDQLANTEGHFQHMDNIFIRAKEIGIAAVNGALSNEDRATFADEVSQLQAELFDVANAQVGGNYLFSGFSVKTAPFIQNPAYDPILDPQPVLYQGDNGDFNLAIGPGEEVKVNANGNALFLGDADFDGVTDPTGIDLFAELKSLESALRGNDPSLIEPHLDSLDRASEQVREHRSIMGNTAQRLDNARSHMEDINIKMQAVLSRYEDADLVSTITDLTQQESAYEAALAVTGRLSQLSILNYLR